MLASRIPGRSTCALRCDQRGSALIMVILLALVIAAIGGTMLIMSNSDHMIASNERDAERALFASRAGIGYAYHLFEDGLILPSVSGATFDSFDPSVGGPLDGAEFTGKVYYQSGKYRIEATGTFNRASRTTELVFQIIPDAFKYGYLAFNEATLHNHSGLSGPTFRIESTVLSNGTVEIPENITIDGSIVASGLVTLDNGSTLTGDIFANAVSNSGTIEGRVALLTSVDDLPASAGAWDRVDADGNKYAWYNGNSAPGAYGGTAPVGGQTSYAVVDGDDFKFSIFRPNGIALSNPDVNVTKYVAPPLLDYQAMKAEADENDPTYFASTLAAVNYLITKKVNETINGVDVTSIRVGTTAAPEFLFIDGDFQLTLDPANPDSPGTSQIQADGLFIEGGLYITGSFDFDGPNFQTASPAYPTPPDYYMLSINALPYCFPALIAYEHPSSGTVSTWTASQTPSMGTGSDIDMKGEDVGDGLPPEGPSFFNGVVFAQNDIHMHHTSTALELIRFNGAELAWQLHNCDFFQFTYDPNIRCTRFLITDMGSPEVVSFREVR